MKFLKHKYRKAILLTLVLFLLLTFSTALRAAVLERGDVGPRVEELQRTLNILGYEVDDDGVFDADTENALKNFQEDREIVVDGIYGDQTRKTMSAGLVSRLETVKYTVRSGDTLSQIANRKDTSMEKIIILNDLGDVSLHPGEELIVPKPGQYDDLSVGRGGENLRNFASSENYSRSRPAEEQETFSYTVRRGDTLAGLAVRFDTEIDRIKQLNGLNDDKLLVGSELEIPGSGERYSPSRLHEIDFMWPTTGRITSGFGSRTHPLTGEQDFHTGVDIAAPHGTPIKASAAGEVVFAGWKGGYGYTVKIDHGSDVETLYAHNSQIGVDKGDYVSKGEVISYSGNTGTSSGPHLHFEIINRGEHVDPLQYLP